jgi:hypothetical protein
MRCGGWALSLSGVRVSVVRGVPRAVILEA